MQTSTYPPHGPRRRRRGRASEELVRGRVGACTRPSALSLSVSLTGSMQLASPNPAQVWATLFYGTKSMQASKHEREEVRRCGMGDLRT